MSGGRNRCRYVGSKARDPSFMKKGHESRAEKAESGGDVPFGGGRVRMDEVYGALE